MAQAHGDRLTAVDASFLAQEVENSHMHVGAVLIYDGPPPGYEDFCNQIRSRLHLVPRYRQKLATPPLEAPELRPAVAAVLGWAVISVVGPSVAGDATTPLGDGPTALTLVGVAVAASLGTLLALRYREGRVEEGSEPLVAPASAVGERIS